METKVEMETNMSSEGMTPVKTTGLDALEAEATGKDRVKIKFRGENLKIDLNDLDDYEAISQMTSGLPMLMLSTLVPNTEKRERLLDTCEKNRNGRPMLSAVVTMTSELMEALQAGK